MIRRPPRSTLSSSSAASDVYKRQGLAYFGNSDGNKAFFTGIARTDKQSICFYDFKAEIKAPGEHDDGKYHHIVNVLTGSYMKFYIDGVLIGQANWSGTIDIGTTYA